MAKSAGARGSARERKKARSGAGAAARGYARGLWAKLDPLRDAWLWPPLGLWLLGQLAPYVWLGALAAEVYLQLGLLALLAALSGALWRRWLRAAAWSAAALLCLAPSWTLLVPARPTPEQGPLLRVAQVHLAGAPLTRAALTGWLARTPHDVISLTELSPASFAELSRPSPNYTPLARTRATRSLLLVRSPLLPPRPPASGLKLRVGRCDVDVVQLVLPPLLARGERAARARSIQALSAGEKRRRSLYLGYLGSRSAAHDLKPLLAAQGLRDARNGHGLLATAPVALGALGLPLDHILVHGWIGVRSAGVAEPLAPGAHRTLQATLELTEPRCR